MEREAPICSEFEINQRKMEEYQRSFAWYNRIKRSYFRWYFRLYHRLEISGVKNVPAASALIAANHSGGYDLDIVSLSEFGHPTRRIHALIANDWHYLYSPWGRYYVASGIPLWTRGGIRWEYIDPYLDKRGTHYPALVSIYPEGNSSTFRHRRRLNMFFPGVVRIALRYEVPIVPAAMIGFCNAAPIFREIERDHGPNDILCLPFTLPVKLKIDFGEPFELSDYYGMKLSKEEEVWVANNIVRPRLAEVLSRHRQVVLADVDAEMRKPASAPNP